MDEIWGQISFLSTGKSPFLPTMPRPSKLCQAWSEELPPCGGIEQVSLVEVDRLPTIRKEVEGAGRRYETHVPWSSSGWIILKLGFPQTDVLYSTSAKSFHFRCYGLTGLLQFWWRDTGLQSLEEALCV